MGRQPSGARDRAAPRAHARGRRGGAHRAASARARAARLREVVRSRDAPLDLGSRHAPRRDRRGRRGPRAMARRDALRRQGVEDPPRAPAPHASGVGSARKRAPTAVPRRRDGAPDARPHGAHGASARGLARHAPRHLGQRGARRRRHRLRGAREAHVARAPAPDVHARHEAHRHEEALAGPAPQRPREPLALRLHAQRAEPRRAGEVRAAPHAAAHRVRQDEARRGCSRRPRCGL